MSGTPALPRDSAPVGEGWYWHHRMSIVEVDTEVFHVLSRKPAVPELIATAQYVFQVDVDGEIKYLGKTDKLFEK